MDQKIIFIILGMSIVTYLPRMLPLVLLSKFELPNSLLKWLSYIPVAVLSALLFPGLLISDGKLAIHLKNKNLIAAIPCFIIAVKTKNLFLTVLIGIVSMFILQNFV